MHSKGKSVRRSMIARFGLAVLLLGSIAASVALRAGDVPKKIRVIYTNDTLGYLEPCG
jgi:P pilus assembly chaperone PapD